MITFVFDNPSHWTNSVCYRGFDEFLTHNLIIQDIIKWKINSRQVILGKYNTQLAIL
jgi:hypothetical protein